MRYEEGNEKRRPAIIMMIDEGGASEAVWYPNPKRDTRHGYVYIRKDIIIYAVSDTGSYPLITIM